MTRLRTTLVAALFGLIAVSVSACDYGCEDCVEVCDVYCDFFGCWEECFLDCVPTTCGGGYAGGVGVIECRGDLDCRQGEFCDPSGLCAPVTGAGGNTALCEPCTRNSDCLEPNSLCLRISDTEQVCGRGCTNDAGCPAGFECVSLSTNSNQCVPTQRTCQGIDVPCTRDSQCPSSEVCSSTGECVGCERDDQCQQGETCQNNACTSVSSMMCSDTQPCPSGQTCQNGQCVNSNPPPPECDANTPCPSGQVCENSRCVDDTTSQCSATQPCPQGNVCLDGTCVTANACTDNSDCVEGLTCVNDICRVISCLRNEDCASSEVCVNAACLPACSTQTACPAGYTCRASLGFCEPDPQNTCVGDASCGMGQVCESGVCRTGCTANCQCDSLGDGYICHPERGVCVEDIAPQTCMDDCDCATGSTCDNGTCVATAP